jgi:hypothetical protein
MPLDRVLTALGHWANVGYPVVAWFSVLAGLSALDCGARRTGGADVAYWANINACRTPRRDRRVVGDGWRGDLSRGA